MKKSKLLALLSIPFMVSCSGNHNLSPVNPDRPTPDPVDPPKPIHRHSYDAKTGECLCGETHGTKIEYGQLSYGDFSFKVYDHKVYFNFETECNRAFYLENFKLCKKYQDKYENVISDIELYNAEDLSNNLFANHNYSAQKSIMGGSYFVQYGGQSLASESKFYCVVTLGDFVVDTEVILYIDVISEHAVQSPWVNSEDGTKRSVTGVCQNCGKEVTIEQTYIFDVVVPEIYIVPGVNRNDNLDNNQDRIAKTQDERLVYIQFNNLDNDSYYTTPDKDSYVVSLLICSYYGYVFDASRTTFKYCNGSDGVVTEFASDNTYARVDITVPKTLPAE